MKRTILIFGLLILALLILLEVSKHTYLSDNAAIEIIFGVIAIVFFLLGIYINKKEYN